MTPLVYRKVKRGFVPLSHHHKAKRDYLESGRTCQMKLLPVRTSRFGDLGLGERVLQRGDGVVKRRG